MKSLMSHMAGSKCHAPGQDPAPPRSHAPEAHAYSPPAAPAATLQPPTAYPSYWTVPCPGIGITWDAETFWDTYPFQIHSPTAKVRPNYSLIFSDPPKIRSNQCLGAIVTANGLLPCKKCSDLSLDVNIIKERASRPFGKVREYANLNCVQLRAKVTSLAKNHNTVKLENLNSTDSMTRERQRLADFVELFQYTGQNSIPGLHRLLSNAQKEGWSAAKTLHHCKLGVDGKYTPKNYTQYEIDLAILLEELGGLGAVYAMNHSIFALPCRNTIRPYRRQHNLVPSVKGVRFTEISDNITAMFGTHKTRDVLTSGTEGCATNSEEIPMKYPHTLSFDEIATERKIDYMTATDEMGGFCLEHVSILETVRVGKDTETVETAVAAVKEGKIHIAPETSVGAISRLSETNYGAKPVFLGPTYKKGGWRDLLQTMETVIEAWKRSPDGEKRHGPVVEVSSDGCPKRRAALFMMCMHSEILPGNPLYPFVSNLPGLNLRVGKDNITPDMDWKHIDKRICTLLRSPEGLVVKNVCINRDLLLTWLERLPAHDWSEDSIHTLLDPTSLHTLLDPSDPQDVPRAMKLMLCVVEIGKLDPEDFDPSEAAEFEAISLLGETFDAWLQPFINVELSLSELIESLVRFAHLTCALYLQNGTSFMPNQLYANIQTTVKNAVLLVPKTRLINGNLKVFICLLGDDVLEALFGRSRMIGRHSPNSSIGELRDRFSSAMNLDYIYERHPELERKPRRLNMYRMGHMDHLRPRHFKRELRSSSCDLEACWCKAVKRAEDILARFGVRLSVPFCVLFKRKDTDLMRPFGGKYPAISNEVDRSMANLSLRSDDSALTVDPNMVNPVNLMNGVDFDAMITREMQERPRPDAPAHSLFSEVNANGHVAHKKTVVRTFFETTHDSHSSHDRLQRVRGFTIGGKSWTRDTTDANEAVSSATHFQLGDLFTTLVCYGGKNLGLAVGKCTLIKRGPSGSKSASVSAIPRAELHLPSSPYTISGQVFSLVPLAQNGATLWAWDGDFISLSLKKKTKANGEEISHLRNLQIAVSSRLIDCSINEKALERLTFTLDWNCDREKTWCFSDEDLRASWYLLWNNLLRDNTLHELYPLFTANTVIEESHNKRHTCRICHKPLKDTDRQRHVGEHILKALYQVEDLSAKVPVSNTHPCGTCGGPTVHGDCKFGIKGGKLDSECPSAYPFMISATAKFHDNRPCTNIPIRYPLDCNEIHWKYNFRMHVDERHPNWRQRMADSFIPDIQITRAEQLALHIPQDKVVDWPPPVAPETPHRYTSPVLGQKRSLSSIHSSPSRRGKENQAPVDSDAHVLKRMRLH
ncbi:hypothetical protein C8J57DRAFT_1621238 [Mycena rebaudengoi]|nr:hypothetical protein C8J57DRAFT_1621238 [Mycena rebaudengoi]